MRHPSIRFKIDIQKEKKTLRAFHKDARFDGGRSLQWGIYRRHPKLKSIIEKADGPLPREVAGYIAEVYRKGGAHMRRDLLKAEGNWRKVESDYFRLVSELFGRRKWPQGKYIAYGTIWTMYPKFLEDKTFQIPFRHRKKNYTNVIVAHEMLHFMFYDYFYARYPRYKRPRYNYFIWWVSEIFNVLVQNSAEWLAVFKEKTLDYPEHRSVIRRIKRILGRGGLPDAEHVTALIMREVQNSRFSVPRSPD